MSKYIYTRMVCKNNNLPEGFGRAINMKLGKHIDGQFKNGERHGYTRLIN